MDKINLLLSIIVKNEADRYLDQVLESAKKYVDFILIIDDVSTDGTVALCEERLRGFPHKIIARKTSLFENEGKARNFQWKECQKLEPEWIMILDGDELFEAAMVDHIEAMLASDKDAFYFRLYDFWNATEYREDRLWQAHHYYRPFMMRNKQEIDYTYPDVERHCGRFPSEITHFPYALSNVRLKHMGWSKEIDRQRKYEHYLKIDPDGKFGNLEQYKSILDEDPNLIRFDELLPNTKKVLISSPVHQKPAILKEFLNGLSKLATEGLEFHYFFIDDNEEEESSKLLQQFKTEHPFVKIEKNTEAMVFNTASHHWKEEVIEKVGKNKDKMLKHALEADFDFIFLVDSDLVLHPETLVHLASLSHEVVSEVFYTAWQEGGFEMPQVWLFDEYGFAPNRHFNEEQKSEIFHQFVKQLKTKGVYPVGGLGACTMISKSALEKGVKFERLYNLTFWGEDRHFCIRAAALGIQLLASTFYPPFHIYRESDLALVDEFWQNVKAGE